MIKKLILLIILLTLSNLSIAQVDVMRDELPNTNSTDSTAVLNNVLRQNQNAINTVGGYFNSNGYLGPANGGTGTNISAFPNGSILTYNSGNVGIGTFGQGTSGQILESQGVGVSPTWETLQISDVDVFTTIGTTVWTAPVGVFGVWVTLQGGGASGASDTAGARGGGGAGAFLTSGFYPVVPGNNYNVVVGAGGAAVSGAGASGNAGGSSSFDANLTASGGNASAGTTGGTGGGINSASNMNASTITAGPRGFSFGTQIAGGNGGNTSGGSCGAGGGSVFGAGASGGGSSHNATNYGTGGSGAVAAGTSGAGFQGIVYILH